MRTAEEPGKTPMVLLLSPRYLPSRDLLDFLRGWTVLQLAVALWYRSARAGGTRGFQNRQYPSFPSVYRPGNCEYGETRRSKCGEA